MILDKIVEDKKVRLVEHKSRISPAEMRKLAEACEAHPASFYEGLAKPGISIIGEFKKASPSLGNITSQIDLTKRIDEYNASVDCISCLTEEDHFSWKCALSERNPGDFTTSDFTERLHDR